MLELKARITAAQTGGDMYGGDIYQQQVMSFDEYLMQREQEEGMNIDPASPLYAKVKQEYEQGVSQVGNQQSLGLMASNLRSLVAKTGPTAAIYDKSFAAAQAEGPEATERFLRAQYINNVLSGSEREGYNNVVNGIENYKAAIQFLEQNPDLKTGFGLKPPRTQTEVQV